jgi:4'-phosphopantetheinyl transferase
MLLGRYLDRDPTMLRFSTNANGKPALLDPVPGRTYERPFKSGGQAPLEFNLSHSRSLVVYGFARTASVGVDVEVVGRELNVAAIARRAFGVGEACRLMALDSGKRELEFLRSWTRHEAELKCRGTGIAGRHKDAQTPRALVTEIEVGSGAAAAVAVNPAQQELLCWEWRS